MLEVKLSPSDFHDWKRMPTTQEILRVLRRAREDFTNKLVDGATLIPGQEAVETAKVVGIVYGIDLILQMEVEDESLLE